MSKQDQSTPFWQRLFLFTVTATLGAVGVFIYLIERKRHQEETGVTDLARRPETAIASRQPGATAIQISALPLTIEAKPARFRRNQPGTITVRTRPGAQCRIRAIYSTGRPPAGLDREPVTADGRGHAGWTWPIGTGGTHVDVTVEVSQAHHISTESSLRVHIAD
jgi:hypothetical protein